MIPMLSFRSIQTGLLLFWSIWLTLVTATNSLEALKQLGVLQDSWTIVSGNYGLLAVTTAAHGVPTGIAALLFAGILAWQLLAAGLFWQAFRSVLRGATGRSEAVSSAFAVSLALWAAFLIATEATVNYLTAPTHMGILIAQLLSLLILRGAEPEVAVNPALTVRLATTGSPAPAEPIERY